MELINPFVTGYLRKPPSLRPIYVLKGLHYEERKTKIDLCGVYLAVVFVLLVYLVFLLLLCSSLFPTLSHKTFWPH